MMSVDWQTMQPGHPSRTRPIREVHMALPCRLQFITIIVHAHLMGVYGLCHRMLWQCQPPASEDVDALEPLIVCDA